MPSWPAALMISAKRRTTSVIGLCRPVRTFASLIGLASGNTMEEIFTWAIRSVVAALMPGAPLLPARRCSPWSAHLLDEGRELGEFVVIEVGQGWADRTGRAADRLHPGLDDADRVPRPAVPQAGVRDHE